MMTFAPVAACQSSPRHGNEASGGKRYSKYITRHQAKNLFDALAFADEIGLRLCFRADGKITRVHPPDGDAKNWWQRLNKVLGTTSSDFVNASLFQIQSACRSPWGGISEPP